MTRIPSGKRSCAQALPHECPGKGKDGLKGHMRYETDVCDETEASKKTNCFSLSLHAACGIIPDGIAIPQPTDDS